MAGNDNCADRPEEYKAQEMLIKQLQASIELYRVAAENSNEMIIDYNVTNNSVYHVSERVEAIFDVPRFIPEGPEYLVACGAVIPESVEAFLDLFRKIRAGVPQCNCRIQVRKADGEFSWGEIVFTTIFGAEGRPVRAIGVLRDITSQMEAQIKYKNELLYRDVIKKYALLSYEADLTHKKVLSGLEQTLKAYGIPYSEEYDDALKSLATYIVWPEDSKLILSLFSASNLLEQFQSGVDKVEGEYRRVVGGQPLWVRCTAYMTYRQQTGSVLAIYYIHDINDAKLEEIKLRDQAERDSLTGVYNKVTAEQLIKKIVETERQAGRPGALFLVDLDDFKMVNDRLGHTFGDVYLAETAQKLTTQLQPGDVIGRMGGDEFVLFIRNLSDHQAALDQGKAISNLFHNAYTDVGDDLQISASVGIALLPEQGIQFHELFRKADLALHTAKSQGRASCSIYQEHFWDGHLPVKIPKKPPDPIQRKSFSENILEYVFNILYEAKDPKVAIVSVLELVSTHYRFGRGYVYECKYENQCCINTYEWCAEGIEPLNPRFYSLSASLLKAYEQRFAQQPFYLRYGKDCLLSQEQDGIFDRIQSRIQFRLKDRRNRFNGWIGFDEYYASNPMSEEAFYNLSGIFRILDLYLWEDRSLRLLEEKDILMQQVMDSWKSHTYIIDPDTYVLLFVNENTRKLISKAAPGQICYEAIRGNTSPCDDCPFVNMVCGDLKEYQSEMYLSPYHLWGKVYAKLVTIGDGKELGIFNCYDFAERRQNQLTPAVDADAFTDDVGLYRALSHSTDDYIFMCDMPKNLFYFPKEMVEEFELPSQVIENAIPMWCSKIHVREQKAFMEDMNKMMSGETNHHNLEYRVKNKEGRWIWLRGRGYVQKNSQGEITLFAGVVTNLGRKSKIDYLSGLPNKYEFEMAVRSLLSDNPKGGGLMLLGLDNFKNINNLYGWEFGDQVIHQSAQKLQSALPSTLQVYRLDGDCFGIYVEEGSEWTPEKIYQRLARDFWKQQQCGEHRYYCTVSGGYASAEAGGVSFHTLFKQAEFALEYSKMEGKNCLTPYSSDLMGQKERTLALIEALRESVDHGCENFEVYFQPQVQCQTRCVESAEALLRWRCKEFGPVSPVEFIPLLEQAGLIRKVGRWVLLKAAEVCREWRKINPRFTVSVNVSYVQLQDKTFIPFLQRGVESNRILPESIHLELTESCIATGNKLLTDSFAKLRKIGFCIELDDFGTGYSSLEILKTSPADVVKIDRAFVCNITNSDFDATFIQFVVALCHSVDIRVCLEGVETWEEYQLVEPMNLDLIQGFLFGRPQNRNDFEEKYLYDGRHMF